MLTVQCATVRRGGRTILADVDAAIRPGRLTALIGPNGAGKSTLLSLMSGDRKPDAGSVRLDGRSWPPSSLPEMAGIRAVIAQDLAQDIPLPVRDVIRFGLPTGARSLAPFDEATAIRHAADQAGVTDFLDRRYDRLSGGERQGVQLARALAQLRDADPGYLLADEPGAHFDLARQVALMMQLRLFAERGGAVAIVLHDVNLAAAWIDEIILMAKGRVVATGSPADVLTTSCIRSVFGIEAECRVENGRPHLVLSHSTQTRTVELAK